LGGAAADAAARLGTTLIVQALLTLFATDAKAKLIGQAAALALAWVDAFGEVVAADIAARRDFRAALVVDADIVLLAADAVAYRHVSRAANLAAGDTAVAALARFATDVVANGQSLGATAASITDTRVAFRTTTLVGARAEAGCTADP